MSKKGSQIVSQKDWDKIQKELDARDKEIEEACKSGEFEESVKLISSKLRNIHPEHFNRPFTI